MSQTGAAPSIALDKDAIIVLGNGPSLAGVDLKLLSAQAATLGMNAAYRYWNEIKWRPKYYACLDLVVGLSHKKAMAELLLEPDSQIEAFLLRSNLIEALGDAAVDSRVVNFDALRLQEPLLAEDPVTTGSHATLWAASLGYRSIVIAGVDGRYKEIVSGARRNDGIELEIVDSQKNPNYFFDSYQQPGDKFCLPNPRPGLHIGAWRASARTLASENVLIANANPHSEVREFPFVDLSALLTAGHAPLTAQHPAPANDKEPSESVGQASLWRRLNEFVRRSGKLAFGGLAATALLSIAAVALFGGDRDSWVVLGAAAAMANLVYIALLYVRLQFIDALSRLDRQIKNSQILSQEAQRQCEISRRAAK